MSALWSRLEQVLHGILGARKEGPTRELHVSSGASKLADGFIRNEICTAKYSLLTFFPLVLLDQFRRLANIYFMVISIIQLSTDLSPTNRYSTIVPLAAVICVSIIKEAYEDYGRHCADRKVNATPVALLSRCGNKNSALDDQPRWAAAQCKDLRVGDLVRVIDSEMIPADLLLLSSQQGVAYVDTASLDGETNLKVKSGVTCTGQLRDAPSALIGLEAQLSCDLPNPRLYSYSGLLRVSAPGPCASDAARHSGPAGLPVSNDNVLLRGMTLRNTGWVVGVVIYTGPESKVQLNARKPPRKRSRLERQLDSLVALVFVILALMCTVTALGNWLWLLRMKSVPFYMPYIADAFTSPDSRLISAGLTWVTSLLLFNNLLPISLIVTLELAKFAQARAIDTDASMVQTLSVDRGPTEAPQSIRIPARARTSNLNESCGQVQYIVTDKTGTLTQNVMTLRAVSIAGQKFRSPLAGNLVAGDHEVGNDTASKAPTSARVPFDAALAKVLLENDTASDDAVEFVLAMALCHTVQVGESAPDAPPCYQAASPDEGALVSAARGLGFELVRRDETSITIQVSDGSQQTWKILAVNEFSSVRRRMSVLLRSKDGRHVLYCKGADSAMVPRLTAAGHTLVSHKGNKLDGNTAAGTKVSCQHESDDQSPPRHSMPSVAFINTQFDRPMHVMAAVEFSHQDGPFVHVSSESDEGQETAREIVVSPLFSSSDARRTSSFSPTSHSSFVPHIGKQGPETTHSYVAKSTESPALLSDAELAELVMLQKHLDEFASGGLRTLVLARREVTVEEAAALVIRHRAASSRVVGRDDAMEEVADSMEWGLELVGATGIEDKLQEDVAKTIAALSSAGIRFVMCTGDKTETAINIGLSCALLGEESDLVVLKSQDLSVNIASLESAKASLQERGRWNPGTINSSLSLVIEGHALQDILEAIHAKRVEEITCWPSSTLLGSSLRKKNSVLTFIARTFAAASTAIDDAASRMFPQMTEITGGADTPSPFAGLKQDAEDASCTTKPGNGSALKRDLLDFMQQCRSVICCRVSPLQKAEVVNLIQAGIHPKPMVLAVGDGGNDVSMIQAADIGVGICGVEGQAAVQASDYSIGAFRFLAPLLLVHGRNNYRRVTLAINYCIYKNMILVFNLWGFTIQTGWSGTSLFESYVSSMWNLLFTSLPILSVAIADTDMAPWAALAYPLVYTPGQRNSSFSSSAVARWIATAVLHTLIISEFCRDSFIARITSPEGHGSDLYTDGCAVHFTLMIVVMSKLALELHSWHWHTVASMALSVVLWLGFVGVYSSMYDTFQVQAMADIYGVAGQLFGRSAFWLLVPGAVGLSLIFDAIGHVFYRFVAPDITAVVQEWSTMYTSSASAMPLHKLMELSGVAVSTMGSVRSMSGDSIILPGTVAVPFSPVPGAGDSNAVSQAIMNSARRQSRADRVAAAQGSTGNAQQAGPPKFGSVKLEASYIGLSERPKRGSAVTYVSNAHANSRSVEQRESRAEGGSLVMRAGVSGEVFDSDLSIQSQPSSISSGNQQLVADLLSGLTRLLRDVRADIRRIEATIQRKLEADEEALAKTESVSGAEFPSSLASNGSTGSMWFHATVLSRIQSWVKGPEERKRLNSTALLRRAKEFAGSTLMVMQSDLSQRSGLSSMSSSEKSVPVHDAGSLGLAGDKAADLGTGAVIALPQKLPSVDGMLVHQHNRRLSARFRRFISKAVVGADIEVDNLSYSPGSNALDRRDNPLTPDTLPHSGRSTWKFSSRMSTLRSRDSSGPSSSLLLNQPDFSGQHAAVDPGVRGGAAKFFGTEGSSEQLSGVGAAYNRFTHRFTDPNKEKLFFKQFFIRKSTRLTRIALLLTFAAVLAYLLLALPYSTVAQVAVRSFMVIGSAVFFTWTCFPSFREPGTYSASMIIALVLAGISKTLVIDSEGVFGQTLFQMGVLLVLRLRFLHALTVCGADLVVYILYSALNPRSTVVLPSFLVYIAFATTFSALSCYTLHCAMREDFMSESKLYLEEKRGYDMLSSMLPSHIVSVLRSLGGKAGDWGGLISDAEPSVTVIFVDIVDFDALVASTTPSSLVAVLDRLWAVCDAVAERYAVTKLETVGKEYVACAGLHGERGDHATACVSMALDILKCLQLLRGRDGRQALQVKIGVHSGPVVAGIVGRNRPQFVLVGDTTNTASRMSSSGIDGCVNISAETFARIKSRFACATRTVTVKSKGSMIVYTVLGRHSANEKERRRSSLALAAGMHFSLGSGQKHPAGTGLEDDQAGATSRSLPDGTADYTNGLTFAREVVPAALEFDGEDEVAIDASDALVRRAYERRHMEHTRIAERVARRSRDVALVWYTYRFVNSALESRWMTSITKTLLPGLRRALFVLALFQVFRILEVAIVHASGLGKAWALDGDPRSRPSLREFAVRLAYLAALAGYYAMTQSQWYISAAELLVTHKTEITSHAPAVTPAPLTSYYAGLSTMDSGRLWVRLHGHEALLLLGGILMTFASYSSRDAALDFIFFFSVTSNSGALSFPAATAINLVSTAVYISVAELSSLFDPAVTGDPGTEITTTVTFFLVAGLVMSGLAQSAVEFYRKHRFGVAALTNDEVARNAGLLHRMLPSAVATKMLTGRSQALVAEAYRGACILFCDVTGFTKMSAEVSPGEVIHMLNAMFAGFEAAAAQHGVFKVQTIGDCFVAVAGIPYVDPVLPPLADVRRQANVHLPHALSSQNMSKISLNMASSNSVTGLGSSPGFVSSPGPKTPGSGSTMGKGGFKSWISPARQARIAPVTPLEDVVADSPLQISPPVLSPFPPLDWPCLLPEAKSHVPAESRNAAMMLRTAVAMLEAVREIRHPRSLQPIGVRIGMHTGDLVGGVIGTKSFRYDCWGSSVLAANTIESSSVPGGVMVSSVTKAALDALDVIQGGRWAIPGISFMPTGRVVPKGSSVPLDTFLVRLEGIPFNEEAAAEKVAHAMQVEAGTISGKEATLDPADADASTGGSFSSPTERLGQSPLPSGPTGSPQHSIVRRISLPPMVAEAEDAGSPDPFEDGSGIGMTLA